MWITLLTLAGVAAALFALFWLRPRLRQKSARQQARRDSVARERELDLEACRVTAASMAASPLADGGAAERATGEPASADTQAARRAVDARRRAVASTAFDPDLPQKR